MLRGALLRLSRSHKIKDLVTTAPVTSRVVERFIAGETSDRAVAVTRRLIGSGLLATIDYLGEDTTEYENGKPKTKEGSWEAGVDGALPGIIMPASPQVGMTYREEYYKGHAEDGASIISTDALAKVPYGRFENGVQTRNFSAIEPDVIEEKIYAQGVGVVLEITVSGGSDRDELLSYSEG